jgi:type VI secretion system FHA domain protein
MKARIKVVSYKSQPPETPIEVDIEESGGSLGRAPGNSCVLPDPDRFISGKHASISFESGKFIITDTSTNGLYFEGNLTPLGHNHSAELVDGQRLVLGDYTLEVTIEDEPLPMGSSPFDMPEKPAADPFTAKPTDRDDFFAEPPEKSADFFSEDHHQTSTSRQNEFTPASEPDNVPSDNQFFSAPNSIPEDWDILSDGEPDSGKPGTMPAPPQQASPPPGTLRATEPEAPQSFAIPTPGASAQPRTQAPTPSGSPSTAFNSFIKGAGIEHLNIAEANADNAMQLSGELLRTALEGLIQMLRARAEVKSEFRMQQTTIRAVENNPLKFSVSVDDALKQMLQPTSAAYLPPKEALSEALDDIEAHQLAVMAGVQAALSAMLKRFDPQALQRHFEQKSGRSLLESKKAWYWEQYEDKYQELLAEAEDSFQELFGEAFSKAYEEQVEKLSVSRKKS